MAARPLQLVRWPVVHLLSRRAVASTAVAQPAIKHSVGDLVHGFRVEKVETVNEFSLNITQLQHERTGAKYVHIARNDPDNVFCVAFRTAPVNSNGVAHILEHTVLCGSQKFPCRDPFFAMLTRSLSSFMNAMTDADATMYPFATCNKVDFYNLLDVYTDAVFSPLLESWDFEQEGWRLEVEDIKDPNSKLIFKGIVFNEMKGALSNQDTLYAVRAQQHLHPKTTYGHVSGGEPLDILTLTHDYLKRFHRQHYHPSNAVFATYGDGSLDKHLQVLNSGLLARYERIAIEDQRIPVEPPWAEPRRVTVPGAFDPSAPDTDKQYRASVSFLLPALTDPYELFVLRVVGSLLLEGQNSPFSRSLIDSNLGAGFSSNTTLEMNHRQPRFAVGLQGLSKQDAERLEGLVLDTLRDVVTKGFEDEAVEALLHQMELSLKNEGKHFGLNMVLSMLPLLIHHHNPTPHLMITQMEERLRQEMAKDPQYLQKKVQEYLLNNKHRLTLIMEPKEDYYEVQAAEEEKKLQEATASITQEAREKLFAKAQELAKRQSAPKNVSCLPTLRISDIEPTVRRYSVEHLKVVKNVPFQVSEQPTNNVTFFRAMFDFSHVPLGLRPYIPIFCSALTSVGAGNRDHRQLSQTMMLKTGAMSVRPHLPVSPVHPGVFSQSLILSSFALDRNLLTSFDLWKEIIQSARFDEHKQLEILVKIMAQDTASAISSSGHSYASRKAYSYLCEHGKVIESLRGLEQAAFIQRLAASADMSEVANALKQIASYVFDARNTTLSVNCSPSGRALAEEAVNQFVNSLPTSPHAPPAQPFDMYRRISMTDCNATSTQQSKSVIAPQQQRKLFVVAPVSVNYAARCQPGLTFVDPASAALTIASTIMSSKYLHREIREKNGAYGGGASFSDSMAFYSYRDPNVTRSLEAFEESLDFARSGTFEDAFIDEAKLSTFQGVDKPEPAGARGTTEFLTGITDDMRQKKRNELLSVSRVDITAAAKHATMLHPGATVVVGSAVEAKNFEGKSDWEVVTTAQL